jgi:hypothetical protein
MNSPGKTCLRGAARPERPAAQTAQPEQQPPAVNVQVIQRRGAEKKMLLPAGNLGLEARQILLKEHRLPAAAGEAAQLKVQLSGKKKSLPAAAGKDVRNQGNFQALF